MVHIFEQTQRVPRPRSEVFAFFADAKNLERITPKTLGFRVLTPDPIVIEAGTHIDYRLSLHGIPFRWRTLIERFDRDVSFVDMQLKGPYKLWRHLHTFADDGDGTRMNDRVEYELPLGPLGGIAHRLFVRRQIEAIFSYRLAYIAQHFSEKKAAS